VKRRATLLHTQIVRGLPAAVVDDVERHPGAFDENAVARLLNGRYMYEYIVAAVFGHDEAESPIRVEKFYCPARLVQTPF
jgi:hypothetical protein